MWRSAPPETQATLSKSLNNQTLTVWLPSDWQQICLLLSVNHRQTAVVRSFVEGTENSLRKLMYKAASQLIHRSVMFPEEKHNMIKVA